MKVRLSIVDLRVADGEKADAFQDFLKESLPKSFRVSTGEPVEIEAEEGLRNAQVRLLAKKFLARERLQDDLRVVAVSEGLAIKERKKKRL